MKTFEVVPNDPELEIQFIQADAYVFQDLNGSYIVQFIKDGNIVATIMADCIFVIYTQ